MTKNETVPSITPGFSINKPPFYLLNQRGARMPVLPIKYEQGPLGAFINTAKRGFRVPVPNSPGYFVEWPNCETYFQSLKISAFITHIGQTQYREKVVELSRLYFKLHDSNKEPSGKKMDLSKLDDEIKDIVGEECYRKVTEDPVWATKLEDAMAQALYYKVTAPENTDLKQELLKLGQLNSTREQEGLPPIMIVIASEHDKKWASGKEGDGENLLGIQLTAMASYLHATENSNNSQKPWPDEVREFIEKRKNDYRLVTALERNKEPLSHDNLLDEGHLSVYQAEENLRLAQENLENYNNAVTLCKKYIPDCVDVYCEPAPENAPQTIKLTFENHTGRTIVEYSRKDYESLLNNFRTSEEKDICSFDSFKRYGNAADAAQRAQGDLIPKVHQHNKLFTLRLTTPASLLRQITALKSEILKLRKNNSQKRLKELKVAFLAEVQEKLSNNPGITFTEAIRQAISSPSSNVSASWVTNPRLLPQVISGVISTRTRDALVDLVKADLIKTFNGWEIGSRKATQLADKIARKTFDHVWKQATEKQATHRESSHTSAELNTPFDQTSLTNQINRLDDELLPNRTDKVKRVKLDFLNALHARINARPPQSPIEAISDLILKWAPTSGNIKDVIAGRLSNRTRDVLVDLVKQDLQIQLKKANVPQQIASKIASALAETKFQTIWANANKREQSTETQQSSAATETASQRRPGTHT